MPSLLDLQSGRFDSEPPQSVRTLRDISSIFRDQSALATWDPSTVVYETHGCPGEVDGEPRLLYATTVLHPGQVGSEHFMTRGHFHVKPERGELMLTLRGTGELLLMDRSRKIWREPMEPGSLHDIDGRYAHRVVNTGSVPLVFFVTWMSDCGHDYESIMKAGFGEPESV
ncbi:MAG TPA: glucose-6-phosphate isomerase family protein [Fimbriimonas sp.]|nr:glucose-6-phosphate isomerase family protein [Fimbriimonas sp.]